MGISELWKLIDPGHKQFSLEQIASDQFNKKKGKGLRVAIDIALWIFQVKTSVAESSVAGDQSQLRAIFFRLCRLHELGIRPVFVFDGSNRPSYKRKKLISTEPIASSFRSNLILLIKQFNFSIWNAHGDAEAECAVLQRLGLVDLVITGDSDVFLFGAGRVMRHWPSKRNELIPCYDMKWIEEATDLDRSDLILIALLRGSDYDSQGTQGVGIQLATGLARCRYHRDLFDNIQCEGYGKTLNEEKLDCLYDSLTYELHHNTQGKLQRKHTSIKLSSKFPEPFIVTDFIHPSTNIQKKEYITWARKLVANLDQYCEPDWASISSLIQHLFKWPQDYLIKRLSLLAFPGYMANTLRLQQFAQKRKVFSPKGNKQKQTRLEDYYKLTSRYRPKVEDNIIKQISDNKLMSDTTQLYRIEWNQDYMEAFHDVVKSRLDPDVYKDVIPYEEKEELDNIWPRIKRQWVDARLIHNLYPSMALHYQTKNKKTVNSTFLIKPIRRQASVIKK
ncbi:PIN domain-like protein [Sporodiniella umbellata]|nr:PIN domain-like protein [Sporodiniella umbellata]